MDDDLLGVGRLVVDVVNLVLDEPASDVEGVRVKEENKELHQTDHSRVSLSLNASNFACFL